MLDDRPVLRTVTLDLTEGLTVLRGPNGAGKTTLLRALAGLVPLTAGTRTVAAAPLFIGHRPMLLRGLGPEANLSFFSAFRGYTGADVPAALRRWGLGAQARTPVERLSAGQRKRASLARIDLETEPLVLLDEPFADLDSEGVALLRASLSSAVARGQAIVLATHFHEELDREATRRLVIDAGELRAL